MTTKITATDAYAEQYADVMYKLGALTQAVQMHKDAFAKAGGRNWGSVGDIARISDVLAEFVETGFIPTQE